MIGPRSAPFLGVVLVLGNWLGCAGTEPIVMPPDSPTHPCMSLGLDACASACERDSGPACLAASVALERADSPEPRRVMALQQRACGLGVAQGCEWYARSVALSPGSDPAVIDEYLGKACDGELASACIRRGLNALAPREDGVTADAASKALTRACELGEVSACAMIVDLKMLGLGLPRDETVAKRDYAEVCALGRSRKQPQYAACHNAESDGDELWISMPHPVLLEPLYDPDPNLQVEGVRRPDFEVDTTIRFCVKAGDPVVTDVTIEDASLHPDIDAALADTVRAWRMRVRPHVSAKGPLCHLMRYRLTARR